MVEEKRSTERHSRKYRALCNFTNMSLVGETLDLSEKGAGILFPREVPGEGEVSVNVYPDDESIHIQRRGIVRWSRELSANDGVYRYQCGIEFLPDEGEADGIKEAMTQQGVTRDILIKAPPRACFNAMAAYDRYPEWQKGMEKVIVSEEYPNGLGKVVEFQFDAYLKTVTFINHYSYNEDALHLIWNSVGGDLKRNDGFYVFAPDIGGRTRATFTVDLAVNFYVPKTLINFFSKVALHRSQTAFRSFVESHAEEFSE